MTVSPTRDAIERRRTLALFLLFAGFYLLTASGHFYAVDEETLYHVTESVVERHTLALPEGAWGLVVSQQRTGDGRVYAIFPPGQALVAVPLYLLGRAAAPLFPDDARNYVLRFFVDLLGPLATAALVALLYRLARALGYRARPSLALAAIYGLATTAWPHGRSFFAEPLTALLLLAAFYALVRGTERLRMADGGLPIDGGAGDAPSLPRRAQSAIRNPQSAFLLSGAAAVAALATKPHAAIALPVLGLYLLGRAADPRRVEGRWRIDARRAARATLAWCAGLALAAAPYALLNARVFGNPLGTGYGDAPLGAFNHSFLVGLYGLTLSTGRGLLWYSPPVLLAAIAWRRFARRHLAEALACLGILLAHLGFYSGHYEWAGGGAWGPRYLMIALPFVMLPAVALLEQVRARRALAALAGTVVAAGVAVQLLGVLVNFDWYIARSDELTRYFSPPASPILVHARTLESRAREWSDRAFPPPDTAVLTSGFAAAEGDRAVSIFPRWTTGAGEILLHPAAREPLLVKLTFFDHRPPALRQPPVVEVDGAPLPEGAVERRDFTGTGEGWVYQFTVPAEAIRRGRASVGLRSATWNPAAAGQGDRDESLGVFVHNVEVWRDGQPLSVRDVPPKLTIEPLPRTPHFLFWWFNGDADRHHLADLWVWYAAVAGFGHDRTVAWIASFGAFAALLSVAGLWLFARTLPAGALGWRRPRRRARGPAPVRARSLLSKSPPA